MEIKKSFALNMEFTCDMMKKEIFSSLHKKLKPPKPWIFGGGLDDSWEVMVRWGTLDSDVLIDQTWVYNHYNQRLEDSP